MEKMNKTYTYIGNHKWSMDAPQAHKKDAEDIGGEPSGFLFGCDSPGRVQDPGHDYRANEEIRVYGQREDTEKMTEERYVEVYFDRVIHETDEGYLFGIDDDETWIAKSQCEMSEPGIVEMPEWVAVDKGLV